MTPGSRRSFLRAAAGVAASGLVLNGRSQPLRAASLPAPAAPADRVNVGFIGVGIRGNVLLEAAKATGQANLVVACDCYQGHLERAQERTEGGIEVNFARYRDLLARQDLDAVIVATPEHWHLQQVLDACEAGKDVYIEKPMTRSIEEGPQIIAAAQRHDRILQAGSQWVSSPLQQQAKELLQAGAIGKVTKVMAAYDSNSVTSAWNYPIPPGLQEGVNFDWAEWLGPAPSLPFDPERAFRYLKYADYSGGIATHLFVHLVTSIQYLLDVGMPTEVMAMGSLLGRQDGREVPDTLDALLRYPEFQVTLSSTMNNASSPLQGIALLGTEGSLVVRLGSSGMDLTNDESLTEGLYLTEEAPREDYGYAVDSWPAALREEFWGSLAAGPDYIVDGGRRSSIRPDAGAPDATVFHLAEFFDCVRARRQPLEGAVMGHQAAAVGHMVNLAWQSGRRMVWDEASQSAKEG